MPQMAPLLWLNLYVFFTIVFALIIIMYFYMKPSIKVNIPTKSGMLSSQTWKWYKIYSLDLTPYLDWVTSH